MIDESARPGSRRGDLARLYGAAGLTEVRTGEVGVEVAHPTFEDWWEPFTLGVGPAGGYVAGLDPERRAALRAACQTMLPDPPFTVPAVAWFAAGTPA